MRISTAVWPGSHGKSTFRSREPIPDEHSLTAFTLLPPIAFSYSVATNTGPLQPADSEDRRNPAVNYHSVFSFNERANERLVNLTKGSKVFVEADLQLKDAPPTEDGAPRAAPTSFLTHRELKKGRCSRSGCCELTPLALSQARCSSWPARVRRSKVRRARASSSKAAGIV